MTVTFDGKELKEIPDGIDMEISSDDRFILVHILVDGVAKIYYRHLDENDVTLPLPLNVHWKELL